MLFNSVEFLIFLPLTTLIYYLIPKKIRYIWLLVISYYFYMCWNPKYAVLIAVSTIITYLSGLGIDYCKERFPVKNTPKNIVVICSFASNLAILFFFKYFDWILENINAIFHLQLESSFSLILPVGISFYTFQALGYTMDVYRGEIKSEKNIIRYALFVSFFPQLVAGPIERSKNLLTQLNTIDSKKINWNAVRDGLCLILYGFFLKLVIADRAAILVNNVFDNYRECGFIELTTAAVLFAIQILCDFNGYTIIAKGSARMLGINLMDNFRQPYFASSIKEFWRRWHISLTSWFTDYLYIPLGGSRKGRFRQMINTMIVFFISGLWHGASWHYVVWGIIHGIYQNIGTGISLLKDKALKNNIIHPPILKFLIKSIKIFFIFVITDIAWVFFRASDCMEALRFLRRMLISFRGISLLELGLEWYDWMILMFSVIIMFSVDILHEKQFEIRKWLYKRNIVLRWLIYLAAFWGIFMFGIYGVNYDTSQFIYFQF